MLLNADEIISVSIFLACLGPNEQRNSKLNSMLVLICYVKLLIVNNGICNSACRPIVVCNNNNLFAPCYRTTEIFCQRCLMI